MNDDGESYSVSGVGTCEDTDIGIPTTYEGLPVTAIAASAFENCTDITSIEIPNSVTSIGESAFYGCKGLTSITIPESVTSIGNYAFSNCEALTEINYNAENCDDLIARGYVFSRAGQSGDGIKVTIGKNVQKIPAYLFCPDKYSSYFIPKITKVVFEEGSACKSIGNYAFYCCESITSMVVPDSVTSIGEYAFYNCTGLTSVTIGNGVTSIGESAFSYTSLTSVTIGNSVTSIGKSAFSYTSLTSVTIGNSVTSIGKSAFDGCKGLTSITIPDSVTSIGNWAFYGCESLTTVNYVGTEEHWNSISKGKEWDSKTGDYTINYNYVAE